VSERIRLVIDRVFSRLTGVYGSQFTGKFSTGIDRDGVDRGIENAKAVWSDELSGFADNLDAIGYAIRNTDDKFAPSAREFLSLCRAAPRKDVPSLEYKPSAEDIERSREAAKSASEAVKPKHFDGLMWAKRPKSAIAMAFVADGKKHAGRFPALARIFDQLVADGIATSEGKLIKRWDGLAWVNA